jgi:hypothetical protein
MQQLILGNDAAITLGEGFGGSVTGHTGSVGTTNEQAGTMLHEIGHWLGLKHGGPEKLLDDTVNTDADINCKPNHASVMSYSRQLPNYLGTNWVLDFSDGYREPLTETALDERRGFFSSSTEQSRHVFAFPDKQTRTPPSWTTGQSSVGANFNGINGFEAVLVSADINNFGIPGCSTVEISSTPYYDYNEWDNLRFEFRDNVIGQFDGSGNINHPSPNGDLNADNNLLQKIQSLKFFGPVPPPEHDGSTVVNPGSKVPIKAPIFEADGTTPLTGLIIHAEYLVKDSKTGALSTGTVFDSKANNIFTEGFQSDGYSLGWVVPDGQDAVEGEYWVTLFAGEAEPGIANIQVPVVNATCPGIEDPFGACPSFKIQVVSTDSKGGPDCEKNPGNKQCQ